MIEEGHMTHGQSVNSRLAMFILMAIVAVLPQHLMAAITPSGDISPTYLGGDPWDIPAPDDLKIGVASDGSITIDLASGVNVVGNAYVAWGEGTQGAATITGAGSFLTTGDTLSVGAEGHGTMLISNGGQATSARGFIGGYDPDYSGLAEYFAPDAMLPNGTGEATVTGSGSTWTTELLRAGMFGNGTLDVNEGGQVATGETWIGLVPGVTGAVHVDGSGSTLTANEDLVVGIWGQGTLTVENGGQVQGGDGYVGGLPFDLLRESYDANYIPDGTGSVTVTGSGSQLSMTGTLTAGVWGQGTVTVSDGAQMATGDAYIGGFNPQFLELADYMEPNETIPKGTGHVTVTGLDSYWEAQTVVVGFSGNGTLDINDAGWVWDNNAFLGMTSGSVGTARVDGLGSEWDHDGTLAVGVWGEGDLTVSGGGQVYASDVYIGGTPLDVLGWAYDPNLMPNGTGTVTVTGPDSRLEAYAYTSLYVGYSGTGLLDVNEGGQVAANLAVVGGAPDATGTVIVHDPDSALSVDGDLVVGAWGNGDVTVAEGGRVTTSGLYIGGFEVNPDDFDPYMLDDFGEARGTGTVRVEGTDSLLEMLYGNPAYVGYTGEGTLEILDGGQVSTASAVVGTFEGSSGRVLVDGAGAIWSIIGGGGASSDTVAEGDGEVVVSNGGRVDVDGFDAVLAVGDTITVGSEGQGILTISNGGTVNADAGVIGGYDPGFENIADYLDPNAVLGTGTGRMAVTGLGSTWNSDVLMVGFSGNGTLDVNEGGRVRDYAAFVGMTPGAVGTANVTGPNSEWDNYGVLGVGAWGQGNLTISGSAQVYAYDVYIGGIPPEVLDKEYDPNLMPNGTGTVTVTGTDSRLEVSAPASLYVGYSGTGTLDINDGGTVNTNLAVLGGAPDADGTVTVHDPGSSLSVDGGLVVGAWGQGDLTVSEGAQVTAGTLYIGGFDVNDADIDPDVVAQFGPANGTGVVIVTGAGSSLDVTDEETLVIGAGGTGALQVLEGGRAYSADGFIGGYLTFDYNEVSGKDDVGFADGMGVAEVIGTGSNWHSDVLAVGTGGPGQLTIYAGGQVESHLGIVGLAPDSSGLATVVGSGATWDNSADPGAMEGDPYYGAMIVGGWGQGQMSILDGGQVNAMEMYIGGFDVNELDGGSGTLDWRLADPTGTGRVTVSGEGSTLQMGGPATLYVGYTGQGYLTVADGGYVNNSADAYVGYAAGSQGTAAVDGDGSYWYNSGDLYVGYLGTGVMTVSNGGQVSSSNGYIGYGGVDGAGQGMVDVNGPGSLWQVDQDLYVGGGPVWTGTGTGVLNVSNGGEVAVGQDLVVWEGGTITGDGTISVEMADTLYNFGTIAPGNSIGTLTVNGNVEFEPNSVYEVEIAGNGTSDKLVVNGSVDILGGAVKPVPTSTIVGTRQYEIIDADSVTGTFDTLDTALLHFYFNDTGLTYDPNSVWLWVDVLRFDDPNLVRTCNQAGVGRALQQTAEGGGNEVTDALQQLDDFNDVRHAYDQLSGQSRPPLAPLTITGMSKFLGLVSGRLQTLQTGLFSGLSDSRLMAMSGPDTGTSGGRVYDFAPQGQSFAVGNGSTTLADRQWGIWGRGYGLYGDRETEGGVPGYKYDVYGGSFGLDYQFTDEFLAGLVGGYSQGSVDYAGSRDNADFEALHGGLYSSLNWDKWYLDAVGMYADLSFDTERFIDLTSERLTGSFDGYELAAYVEAGQNWDLAPNLRLQPLASFQYTYLNLDAYTESGGPSALAFDEQTHESLKGSLGARLTQTLIESAGDFRADVQLRGRWVHEFGDNQSRVDTWFASEPTAVFSVSDEAIARDSAVLGAGLSANFGKQTRAYVDYDTRFNSDETIQVISAALQHRW